MPYDSGEDSGAEDTGSEGAVSGSDEDYDDAKLPEYEDARIRREEDPRYAIYRTTGPNFDTFGEQLDYRIHPHETPYSVSSNITSLTGLQYLNPPKTVVTSLFSVKSINRDISVWPSPFYFSIKTPRVYKNVTKFQLVQISFPNTNDTLGTYSTFVSSFIEALLDKGLSTCCISTCISVTQGVSGSNSIGLVEQARLNVHGHPMLVSLAVPDGRYREEELATGLNFQANNTPPFNLISFEDFKATFQTTHDISVLFNEPGDLFHSALTARRYVNPTKETIMNCYYSQAHVDSFFTITDKIAFNAYYYPVLKELMVNPMSAPFVATGLYTFDDIKYRVVQIFEGLDSDFYYEVGRMNRGVLDTFRTYYTFQYKNINKYIWSYNDVARRYSVVHNELHTSIRRDISQQLGRYLESEYVCHGLTPFQFKTLKNEHTVTNAVFQHMQSHLSTVLANYHLVSGYQYAGGAYHVAAESTFRVEDLQADGDFDSMFRYTTVFGNQFGNLPGTRFAFQSFADYHSTLSSYYGKVQSMNSTIQSIHDSAYEKHHRYVAGKYKGILPEYMITNRTYLDGHGVPVTFGRSKPFMIPGDSAIERIGSALSESNPLSVVSLGGGGFSTLGDPCDPSTCSTSCQTAVREIVQGWYSCLPVQVTVNTLGYRLGLSQLQLTNYQFTSSLLNTLSTQNANYFLQINEEQNFNQMDVAMNENYDKSNETTGQVKLMFAKILTSALGVSEVSQTVIQNPALFPNTLGKLDKLSFKIYYDDAELTPAWLLLPFKDLLYNEWDATFQIDEEIGYADRNTGFGATPTVPIPTDPAAMPYLGFTTAANPNNK